MTDSSPADEVVEEARVPTPVWVVVDRLNKKMPQQLVHYHAAAKSYVLVDLSKAKHLTTDALEALARKEGVIDASETLVGMPT